MTIGENIRRLRKERKQTQKEMADIIGISRTYLTDLENNRKNLSSKTLQSISDKLDVSMYYLTTGNKAMNDMTDEELEEQIENSKKSFEDRQLKLKGSVKEDFIELYNLDLSFNETNFLNQAITFLKESHGRDLMILTSLLKSYNDNENIAHVESNKKMLEEDIKDIQEFIGIVFKSRFGLAEYDKPEKSD